MDTMSGYTQSAAEIQKAIDEYQALMQAAQQREAQRLQAERQNASDIQQAADKVKQLQNQKAAAEFKEAIDANTMLVNLNAEAVAKLRGVLTAVERSLKPLNVLIDPVNEVYRTFEEQQRHVDNAVIKKTQHKLENRPRAEQGAPGNMALLDTYLEFGSAHAIHHEALLQVWVNEVHDQDNDRIKLRVGIAYTIIGAELLSIPNKGLTEINMACVTTRRLGLIR